MKKKATKYKKWYVMPNGKQKLFDIRSKGTKYLEKKGLIKKVNE
jgi:hypothetical protein